MVLFNFGALAYWRKSAWLLYGGISLLLHILVVGALCLAFQANMPGRAQTGAIKIDLAQPAKSSSSGLNPEMAENVSEALHEDGEAILQPVTPNKNAETANSPSKNRHKPQKRKRIASGDAHDKAQARTGQGTSKNETASPAPEKGNKASLYPPAPHDKADNPQPVYPELARKRGQEGTAYVRCRIGSRGEVIAVSLAKSSGYGLLDEAALKAVQKWKFRAAARDGANETETVVVPVQFRLR